MLGAVLFFSLNVLGHYYFQFSVTGEPERLVPETDLCIILFLGLVLHTAWTRWPDANGRALIAALAVALFIPGGAYLVKPWHHIVRTSEYKHRLEYRIAEWVHQNRRGMRSQVTGTVRFWWNAWFNEAQIGGGSEQGLSNPVIMPMFWKLVVGETAEADILWLQAFGVDNLVVNDKTSALPLCDFEHPKKYVGKLQVLWEEGGNWIYAIPRKHGGLARVVEIARHDKLRAPAHGDDIEALQPYAEMLEAPATPPATTKWLAPDTLEVEAETRAGEALTIQVAHDPYWSARENGLEYKVTADPFGQMRVDVPPGRHKLTMHFETPLENRVGRWASLLTLFVIAGLLVRRQR